MLDNDRSDALGIADLARRAGVTPRTIRYYVAEGLLPPPGGAGQRRTYGPEHLWRLERIRQLKAAYLPLHEIRRRLNTPDGAAAPPAIGSTSSSRPVAPPLVSAVARSATRSPPGGAAAPLGMGRVEIYEPTDSTWRRVVLAPDIELHVRQTEDPDLAAAVERVIQAAIAILSEPVRR